MVSENQRLLLTTLLVFVFLNLRFEKQRRYVSLRHEDDYEFGGQAVEPGVSCEEMFQ